MWFAGIDWADQHHDVAVVDANGCQVGTRRVAHSATGLQESVAFLLELAGRAEDLVCLVETSHGLLITALLEAGLHVYPVNPKTVDRTRPPSGGKTDALDALLLARKGRAAWPDLRLLRPDGPLVQGRKTLTRDQNGLIVEQTRLVNQLTDCLKTYYPAALACSDGLTRQVARRFLGAYPPPEQAQAASEAELVTLLRDAHYPRPAQKAAGLRVLLSGPQLRAAPGVGRAKARLTSALVAQLCVLTEQMAAYDHAIGDLFAQHADAAVFASLPGAGRRLAPRLLAEWGEDRERYGEAARRRRGKRWREPRRW
jgi:transposase